MATLRFGRNGRVTAIWDDALAEFFTRAFGPEFAVARRRASIIMTVEEGRHAGCFYADMSYLADIANNGEHRLCLWPPRPLESECKQDEVEYVRLHYIQAQEPPKEE